jgi:hypothetical protein
VKRVVVLGDEELTNASGGAKSAFSQLCEAGAKAKSALVATFFYSAATAAAGGNRICVPGG